MTGSLKKQLISMGLILLVVLIGAWLYINQPQEKPTSSATHSDEVHVHSDFLMYLDGQIFDLSEDMYQSTTYDVKHPSFHLHDGVGTMLHRHAEGITMSEFLSSLGFAVSEDCLATGIGDEYCANKEQELSLYVNGERVSDWINYVTQEKDRVLLYQGDSDEAVITSLLNSIPNEACIYSGTCPERGDPPYESCALTCEI